MREAWESLIRNFVCHPNGTNRALTTQTIYRRAAVGPVEHLARKGSLPAPRQLTRRHVEGAIAHLVEIGSPSTANVTYRALQQSMKWLLDEEEIDRSPMKQKRPPIVPEKPVPVPVPTEAHLRALLAGARGSSFVDRRDTASMRLLLNTGGRLSAVADAADQHGCEPAHRGPAAGSRPPRARAVPVLEISGDVRRSRRWAAGCGTARR